MKILLSLLGSLLVTTSGGIGTVYAVKSQSLIYNVESQKKLEPNFFENEISYQFNNFQQTYNKLSQYEKYNLALELEKISTLNENQIDQYLATSKNEFVKNNQNVLRIMYFLSSSMEKISTFSLPTAQLDFSWTKLNEYLDLGFTDSTDYGISSYSYGPSAWWKFWEWGLRVDFHEGVINIMKVVRMLCSVYGNNFNISPFVDLLYSTKEFFNYLLNIDEHYFDKISVLNDLLIKTEQVINNSGISFTSKLKSQFSEAKIALKLIIELDPDLPVAIVASTVREIIEKEFNNTPLEEIKSEMLIALDGIIDIMETTKKVINVLNARLPNVVWVFIKDILAPISNQMINADKQQNGVYILFSQFIIPLGFNPR